MVTSCQELSKIVNVHLLYVLIYIYRAYEPVPGSQGHRHSGHLHHVEAVCGTMQYPPFFVYAMSKNSS
jgi:hypothetical protein